MGSAALAAFILLMLLGTQILSWQVALVIPLAAAVAGLYAASKRVPSMYRTAQIIDRRMSLSDTLSTAWYFRENRVPGVVEEIRSLQLDRAEREAAGIDPKRAVPFCMPRSIYATAVLAVVASSLFAIRYGLTRSLDLQPPLARILQQTFGTPEPTHQAVNRQRKPKTEPPSDENQDLLKEDQDAEAQQQSQSENNSDQGSEPDAAKAEDRAKDGGQKGDEAEPAEGEEKNGPGDEQQGDDESKSGQSGDTKADSSKEGGKNDSNNPSNNESNSLFNKVKDFAQNLLSKVKAPNQSGQQASGEQNSKQSKGQQSGNKQKSAKNGQKSDGQQGDAQEGEAGEQAENSQDSDSKANGKNDAKESSKQPGSGMGTQDGDKRIKQAEQLAAMGKISEIIGKRSANVTGEATVEVKSTSQQIRTPYAQRGVQHSQSGAEINRDEVPVALQSYVEQYFEQVRKQPQTPAQAPPPAGKKQ